MSFQGNSVVSRENLQPAIVPGECKYLQSKKPLEAAEVAEPPGSDGLRALIGQRPLTLRELRDAKLKRPNELVQNMFCEGETVAVVAKPKTGKTRLSQQLAVAVASGQGAAFLGQRVLKQAGVLYIDLESNAADVHDRFSKIAGASWDTVQDRIHVYSVTSLLGCKIGLVAEGLNQLTEWVRETNAGLLIIDTWRLIALGKENEAETVVQNLSRLGSVRAANSNLTIVIVHHLRKAGIQNNHVSRLRVDAQQWLDNVSGSHALVAHTDATFGFEREESSGRDVYVLSGVRRGGEAPLLILDSDESTLRFEPLKDRECKERTVFTAAQLDLWRSLPEQFDWKKALEAAGGDQKKSHIHRTLQKAEENGLLERDATGAFRKTEADSRSLKVRSVQQVETVPNEVLV